MTFDPPAHGLINPYALMPPVPEFTLVSNDIQHGEPLPQETFATHAQGLNLSPHLSWSEAPAETRSYAVTCYDPDAPTGSGFWHWAVANIPADITRLERGAGSPDSDALPEGSLTLPNERRQRAFAGAAPPVGTGVHHYWFTVHALSVRHLDIDPESTPAVLGFMMREVALARASIVATGEHQGWTTVPT